MGPLILLYIVLSLVGCGEEQAATTNITCYDHAECGDKEACIDSDCVAVDCLSSGHCLLDTYCDDETYTCLDGCELDADCSGGQICDEVSASCQSAPCVDTNLDCHLGEVCNLLSG